MATISTSQGLIDDGSGNLTVAGLSVSAQNAMLPQSTTGSAFCVIPGPGFYQIPVTGSAGQGNFTGSLPNPAAFPGGEILITDTVGTYAWKLTGSMSSFSSTGAAGGAQTISSSNGTQLFMPAGGTIGFWSDAKSWLICACSGSATLKP